MKLLITGGAGMVGSRVIELLSDHNWINADYPQVDITNKGNITQWFEKNFHEASWLIHMAAFTNVAAAEDQRDDIQGSCYKLNVGATQTLTDLCKRHHIPMLYVSTGYVYPGTKFTEYTEKDEPEPRGWYGQTKYLGEQSIESSDIDYTIIRIDYPFRNDFPDKPDWARSIQHKLADNSLYPLFTDQWITPTWVDDIAFAIEKIISNQPANTVFNVVGDTQTTPFEAAQMVAERLGYSHDIIKPGKLSDYQKQNPKAKKIYPNNLRLSNQKFCNAYAFKFHDLAQALDIILKKTHNQKDI